ncbi:hypothetical protein EB809_04945 [Marinobacter sp. R17]|uniref:hypothetical protein n=1 Tax=Marinobacter sp. R17 TaxID=2484250 RepID=UPI000F4B7295|nr:hypothetical protein [Marinobacter sp. R17]ROU01444.1 hypothetical protein EB809_04945 [Marinobacter sp. R17]
MAAPSEWKNLREEHDAAWRHYQDVSERVHEAYESLDSGLQDQAPPNEDLAELRSAWQRLESARQQLADHMDEAHEKRMDGAKSMSS